MTFNQDGRRFRAIAWRAAEAGRVPRRHRAGVNLAFSLERNEYQGETYLELNVADIKSSTTYADPCRPDLQVGTCGHLHKRLPGPSFDHARP